MAAGGSALYKLNHTYTAGEAAEVSDTLYLALTQAYNICRDSQGALDITIRPLANLWNIESATDKISGFQLTQRLILCLKRQAMRQ